MEGDYENGFNHFIPYPINLKAGGFFNSHLRRAEIMCQFDLERGVF